MLDRSKFIPLCILGISGNYIPKILLNFLILLVIIAFFYGYFLFIRGCCKYCKIKGYSSRWGLLGIFSLLVLPFLFLLKSKVVEDKLQTDSQENLFKSISIAELLIASISIITWMFLIPYLILGQEKAEIFLNNNEYENLLLIIAELIILFFLYKYLKINSDDWLFFLGNKRKSNVLNILIISILLYLFAKGFNRFSLYYLSFIFPNYVENYLKTTYFDSMISFIYLAIAAIILAPITEELLFRGAILHKIAVKYGIIIGISISSLIFSIAHFRFDIITLFMLGILSSLIYIKTQNLLNSIFLHAFYNTIVSINSFYYYIISDETESSPISLTEYQETVRKSLGICFLLVSISLPYLIYFIYKNWPKKNQVLPYFVNEQKDFN